MAKEKKQVIAVCMNDNRYLVFESATAAAEKLGTRLSRISYLATNQKIVGGWKFGYVEDIRNSLNAQRVL